MSQTESSTLRRDTAELVEKQSFDSYLRTEKLQGRARAIRRSVFESLRD